MTRTRLPRRTAACLAAVLAFLGLITIAGTAHAAGTLTLTPTADTFVTATDPTSVHGTDVTGKIDDVPKIVYVKFTVSGVPAGAPVTSATLKLVGVGSQTTQTVDAYSISGSFSEATTTYNNRPALGALLGSAPVGNGVAGSFTVPVTGNGTYTYAVTRSSTGTDQVVGLRENTTAGNRPSLTVNYGDVVAPPVADYRYDPVSGDAPLTVTFDNISTGATSYLWDFGDGTTSTAAEPGTHVFSAAGSYPVKLTATNSGGSNSITGTVTVTTPPPPPPPPPPADTAGILLSPAQLAALPTTGAGWQAIVDRVNSPYGGCYCLGQRDDSNKDVLAHALYGARLGDATAKAFVRDKISAVMAGGRDTNDVLATLRNLSAYIISADLIDLKTYAPSVDTSFRSWLRTEINFNYAGGGGGGSVVSIHDYKANNFGTHAGADRLAADLYLGTTADLADYQTARDVWYGWATGDPFTDGRNWTGTNWQCTPTGTTAYGINPAGCTRDGHSFDGIIPEDMTRQGEYTGAWPPYTGPWPPATGGGENYIQGAMDGATLSFAIITHHGENAWAWGSNAAKRQLDWKYANGQPPYSGFKWQIPVIEKAYGVDYTGNDPTATSTNFGYADWWAGA
jgi:PKD repeat protein